MITCKKLTLPEIPVNLLPQDFLGCRLQTDNTHLNNIYPVTRAGQTVPPAYYRRWEMQDSLLNWIHAHVTRHYYQAGYAITQDASDHLPHRDAVGDYKICYLVKSGGPNVITTFNQTSENIPSAWRPNSLDELIEIDSYHAQENKWFLINTRIVHGVTGMISPRHVVSLTFCGDINESAWVSAH